MIGERTVTLIDGRQVSNTSEEWRAECEARTVCMMPSKSARRMYVFGVEQKRGAKAAGELSHLVKLVWAKEFARE